MSEANPIGLSIRNAVKVYPGTRALKGVDFDIRMGAVNVLVGENGAGKSTLMKVIAGVEPLTEGQIKVDGKPVRIHSKDDAVDAGIGIVFQELNLFPELSIAENIFMGREPTKSGFHIDEADMMERSRVVLERLEQAYDPSMQLGLLRLGQQQVVEIAKALAQDARILILDEPTSALSASEVESLFHVIKELKAQGVGIVYISHRLEELIRVGDFITVLRDGEVTGDRSMDGVDIPWIVNAMIGDKSKDFAAPTNHQIGAEVFRAENVVLPKLGGGYAVDHVSISAKAGEIVGIYGLMGAGRSELMECIIGRHPDDSMGRYFIDGEALVKSSIADRIAHGISLVPEDRKQDGLVQMMSIRENLTLSSLGDLTTGFHLRLGDEIKRAADYIRRLTIKVSSAENPVSSLSGGNQQKVVIGKALMTKPKVLLMDEPSRGIDIGAKAEIYRVMRQLSQDGLAVIFASSEVEEVMALSDRIVVMADGKITGTFEKNCEMDDIYAAASPITTELEAAS